MEKRKVSIVMAVYNGEKYIKETIESILEQNYDNFELIIVDDCSEDETINIIKSFDDNRITVLHNEKNMRLAYSLNRAIEHSTGIYIARMDADDICLKNRIETQAEYLDSHPAVAVLGGKAQQFGASNKLMEYPIEHEQIKVEMLFSNPLCHPAVMFRKNLVQEWYDSDIKAGQDYELWSRLIWKVQFHNLPQTLIKYRIHGKQTRNLLGKSQKQGALIAYKKMLDVLGDYQDKDALLLADAGNRNTGKSIAELQKISALYEKIYSDAERKRDLFDLKILRRRINDQKGMLIYASLIFNTISWREVSKTGMAAAFFKKPELVMKAIVRDLRGNKRAGTTGEV